VIHCSGNLPGFSIRRSRFPVGNRVSRIAARLGDRERASIARGDAFQREHPYVDRKDNRSLSRLSDAKAKDRWESKAYAR
jgi:hypothetical protein